LRYRWIICKLPYSHRSAKLAHDISKLSHAIKVDTHAIKVDTHAIKVDTHAIKDDTHAIQSGVDRIWQDQDYARYGRFLEWISPTDYPAQQSDIIKRRQEGTGQWFLDAPEVRRWLSEAKGTLFCPGIPGAGKTMVAAIAIDYLLKLVQNSSNGVAYVFCNYKARKSKMLPVC
jgi:hypothetical protein